MNFAGWIAQSADLRLEWANPWELQTEEEAYLASCRLGSLPALR
jgi:hypothetical protein